MSVIQRTEKTVSSNAKIVKRGDQYVLVDMTVMFPDEIWRHIKSFIPQSPHPYLQYKKVVEQPSFKESLEKWSKKDIASAMGSLIYRNTKYDRTANTRGHYFVALTNPQTNAYRAKTKTELIGIFQDELKERMRRLLCVERPTKANPYKLEWRPLTVSKIPADKLELALEIFQFCKRTKNNSSLGLGGLPSNEVCERVMNDV
jgi:hypothetical protein